MIQNVLQSVLLAGVALVLALPALGSRQRGWIAAAAVVTFLYSVAIFLPIAFPHLLPHLGREWNWTGKLTSIAVTTLTALVLLALAGFRPRALRHSHPERPSRARRRPSAFMHQSRTFTSPLRGGRNAKHFGWGQSPECATCGHTPDPTFSLFLRFL